MAETTNDISSSGKESFCMFNGSGTYGYLAEEAIGYVVYPLLFYSVIRTTLHPA